MESSWSSPNYKEYYQDIVEGLNKIECSFILWIYDNYIHQTKHDGIFSIDSYDPHMFLILFGSWRMDVEFGIVSMTNDIVKYSSSNKLKPILFPEGSNSI